MLREPNTDLAMLFQDVLIYRIETLQAVVTGKMSPLERRIEIAKHRSRVFSRTTGSQVAKSSSDEVKLSSSEEQYDQSEQSKQSEQSEQIEQSEQNSNGFNTADSVEVRVESPSDDQIRVANFLAEKYPEAKRIAIISEDNIKVSEPSGGSFTLDVSKVLSREFGESNGSETKGSSTPSMSTAAAEKLS